MIKALEDMAWVKFEDGRMAPFDEQQLALSIQDVAERAGHSDWWLAESVAAAVHAYAIKSRSDGVIPTREIVEIVVAVLATLGFEKISEAYAGREHCAAIHLNDLAARVGAAFELEFFRQLDSELGAASDHRLAVIEVDGLRACVMQLRGARRWTVGCRELAEEIVDYVRERVARVRPAKAECLRLAVVE
ncbi:MAG TPA: ATP cone domain-containing protein [Verrucomicrobiae bacterium]|nr:ATP cone domain-containing protein [Verrucomicrobiae bacterium]